MIYSDIPKIVTKFFELQTNKGTHEEFNITTLPWLELKLHYKHGDRLVRLIEEKIKPHTRYFNSSESRGIEVFDVYGPIDKEKYREYRNQNTTKSLNTLDYGISKELIGNSEITELLNLIPYKNLYEVYINAIRPGGYLYPHIDKDPGRYREGLKDQIAIHISNPAGYKFSFLNHGEVPKSIGVPTCLNTNKYIHCVVNDSNQTRYLIHMHGEHSTELEKLMLESFTKRLV